MVFDPLSEHDEKNFDTIVYGFDGFSEAILKSERKSRFRILYRFDIESDSHDDEFNQAMRVLYYCGNLCVYVEEAWRFSSKGFLPKWFRESFLTGRHRKLAVIVTTQRPASLHKDILAQTNQFFSGVMFESNDVKYLAEFLGKENAESLRSLPPFQFLHYRPGQKATIIKNKA